MTSSPALSPFSPTTIADLVDRKRVMETGIRPLWHGARLVGPAFTVKCPPGDNLMLHAAIYRASPGDVLVVEAGDADFAMAGGNVCAVAQKLGIAGMVIDGVIRDLAEVREMKFPVFARGVVPKPGLKAALGSHGEAVRCGGVLVRAADMVVADEEGVVVVPSGEVAETAMLAQAKVDAEAAETLEQWQAAHEAKIDKALAERGFHD